MLWHFTLIATDTGYEKIQTIYNDFKFCKWKFFHSSIPFKWTLQISHNLHSFVIWKTCFFSLKHKADNLNVPLISNHYQFSLCYHAYYRAWALTALNSYIQLILELYKYAQHIYSTKNLYIHLWGKEFNLKLKVNDLLKFFTSFIFYTKFSVWQI